MESVRLAEMALVHRQTTVQTRQNQDHQNVCIQETGTCYLTS